MTVISRDMKANQLCCSRKPSLAEVGVPLGVDDGLVVGVFVRELVGVELGDAVGEADGVGVPLDVAEGVAEGDDCRPYFTCQLGSTQNVDLDSAVPSPSGPNSSHCPAAPSCSLHTESHPFFIHSDMTGAQSLKKILVGSKLNQHNHRCLMSDDGPCMTGKTPDPKTAKLSQVCPQRKKTQKLQTPYCVWEPCAARETQTARLAPQRVGTFQILGLMPLC